MDLTKITTQLSLLEEIDPDTATALQECGGPYQFWSYVSKQWRDVVGSPTWDPELIYRKKPEPRVYVAWQVCTAYGAMYGNPHHDEGKAVNFANNIGGFVVKLTGTKDDTNN